ncbi:MAG: hypothetical protein ABSC38_04925 [Verrucomicrobiia bacterium]
MESLFAKLRGKTVHFFLELEGHSKRSLILGALILFGLTLLMFGDVLVTSRQIVLSDAQTDLAGQFIYWREFAACELKQGNLPLWNPHVFSGMPFLGWSQPGLLYPPNWLDLVLPLSNSINLGIALHVFLAGLFTYFWIWRRGLHPIACVVAAALFMFSGAYFSHVFAGHLSLLFAAAWMPLLFVAIDGLFETRAMRWVLLGMFAVTMQILAGDFQVCFYTAVAAGVYSCLCLIGAEHRTKTALGLVGMYMGAILLGAVQLFTSIQAASESVRSGGLSYEFAGTFSFPPENLITLIMPGFLGDMIKMPYWGRWHLWETCLFLGVTGLILLAYGAVRGNRELRRFSLPMALILIVLALGSYTPLFKVLYHWMPGFDRFRGNAKFIIQASLFMVMLAGIGMDHLLKNRKNHNRVAPSVILLIAGGVLASAAVYLRTQVMAVQQPNWWSQPFLAISALQQSFLPTGMYTDQLFVSQAWLFACYSLAILAGLLVLLAGLLFAVRFWKPAVYLIALLAVAEVFAFSRHSRTTFDLASTQSAWLKTFIQQHPGDYRIFYIRNSNVAMWLQKEDIWGYAPLVLKRYAEFMAFTQGQSLDGITQYVDFYSDHTLFRMLRCKFVFVPMEDVDRVRQAKTVMSHLQLIQQCRVISGRDAIFQTMDTPSFDPETEVILEAKPDPFPVRSTETGSARIIESSCNYLTIEVDIPQPAILLVTDAYSNGWRARPLPGSVQSVYRVMPANYILRAIPLAKGHHRFRLEYLPTAFQIGMWISAISCLFYALAVAWHFKGRHFR